MTDPVSDCLLFVECIGSEVLEYNAENVDCVYVPLFLLTIFTVGFFFRKNVTLYNKVLLVNLLTMIKTFVAVLLLKIQLLTLLGHVSSDPFKITNITK